MNFGPKAPKPERWKRLPFTIHNPHTKSTDSRQWFGFRRFVSIDPGGLRRTNQRSFGFRIERRPMDSGPIKMEVFEVVKFTHPSDEYLKDNSVSELYKRITEYLDRYREFYKQTHVVVIEEQLPINTKSVRVMQHVISYFSIILKDLPLLPMIIEIDNKLKTQALDSPRNLNEKGIKDWSIEIAKQLLQLRGDTNSIQIIIEERKKDDLADTVLQVEALCICMGWPSTYRDYVDRFTLANSKYSIQPMSLKDFLKAPVPTPPTSSTIPARLVYSDSHSKSPAKLVVNGSSVLIKINPPS